MPIAKAVGGGGFCSALAIEPSWALRPGRQDQCFGGSADDRTSHEHKIGWERGLARGRADCRLCVLFGWISLTGEKRFIDIKVARFDQSGIGGHEIAGREKNDIARHDLRRRNVDRLSVAKRLGGKRDLLAQTFGSVLGLALLRHVEDHGHEHNGGDDDEARNVSCERRYPAAKSRIKTSGLLNLSDKGGDRGFPFEPYAIRFGPTVLRIAAASAAPRPLSVECSCRKRSGSGTTARSDISGPDCSGAPLAERPRRLRDA